MDGVRVTPPLISNLGGPSAVAIYQNVLYVANFNSGAISTHNLNGTVINANFVFISQPISIAVKNGYLYACSWDRGIVTKWNSVTGEVIASNFITGLNRPADIFITDSYIYVTTYSGGFVGKYNLDGTVVNSSFISNLANPIGISVYQGSIFVGIFSSSCVNKYDESSGSLITSINVTSPTSIQIYNYNLYIYSKGQGSNGESSIYKYSLGGPPMTPSNLVWDSSRKSLTFTVPSGATTISYSIDGTTNYIAFSSATSPQTINLANYNTSYPLNIVASNSTATSEPASLSISIPSLLRATAFTQPLYLQQLDTVAMFSTILSNTSIPPTDSAFNAVLNCSTAFTAALNNAYRFAIPAEVMANQPITNLDFDYTKLLFYQAGSSGASTFFASPSRVDITQGLMNGSSPVNTVTEDYIKELALFFFGDRKANVMFTNSGTATTALSTLVAGNLSSALSDYTVFDVNSANFDTKFDIGLLIFKAIVYNDPACFASLTPANALRTFTYPAVSGITYYEYGLPIMAGDSIVIHLQIQPNSSQMTGQAWEPVKTGPAPTRNYSIKLICG
jgi:hypothetical protein